MDMFRDSVRLSFLPNLHENFQLADKIYFKTNKLSQDEIDMILGVTSEDSYTKALSDAMYFYIREWLKNNNSNFDVKKDTIKKFLSTLYDILKEYKTSMFSLNGFDTLNITNDVIDGLTHRYNILALFEELPSVALRNTPDKKKSYTPSKMEEYYDKLDDFVFQYQNVIKHHSETTINTKLFKKGFGIEDWQKQLNIIETANDDYTIFSHDDVIKLLKDSTIELKYKSNGAYLFKINSADDVNKFGCDSNWCFSYIGYDLEQREDYWNAYSFKGSIYAILDLNLLDSGNIEEHKVVILEPFLTSSREFLGLQSKNKGFGHNFESSFYDTTNENMSISQANAYWNRFLSHFDDITKEKIIKEMIMWGLRYL